MLQFPVTHRKRLSSIFYGIPATSKTNAERSSLEQPMPRTVSRSWLGKRLAQATSNSFARYLKDSSGATAVEFAIVSVPFLGLLFAIFETALVFFTAQSVEAATSEAARRIMTGQAQGNSAVTSATQFRDTYTNGQSI